MLLPAFLPLLAVLLPIASRRPEGVTARRIVATMGTELQLELAASTHAVALAQLEAALTAVESCAVRLSTWSTPPAPPGDLARLNAAAPGTWVECELPTTEELQRTSHWSRETRGAFDVAVGTWIALYDLRGTGRWPEATRVDALRAQAPFAWEVAAGKARRLSPLTLLEEGGFGKGAALDAALGALRAAGATSARLDLGGHVTVLGPTRAVDIADPDRRDRAMVRVSVGDASLSTSGNSEHGLRVDGRRLGHLLDPRTGRPASDWGSLSVRAPRSLDADCLSTGLFVLGPDAALDFARTHPGIDVLCLVREGARVRVRASAGLVPDLHVLDSRGTLESASPTP
jgi:thiamine biosynthesis lipoprotein